jgi:hypothetical protein
MSAKISADAPVAYFVYNRPGPTRESFAALRAQRPRKLFVVADGPRHDRHGDQVACERVRDVVSSVDWPCEVLRNYSDRNMGCQARVTTGMNWVLSQVDRIVVLEDDNLVDADYFTFCAAMLQRYAGDERVWHVSGGQYWAERPRTAATYYFSKYPHVWGWATWARAWRRHDVTMQFWPDFRRSAEWRRLMPLAIERRYWTRVMDRTFAGNINSYAYPWIATIWRHGGLTANPYANLVENIGLGPGATHTTVVDPTLAPRRQPLGPLVHPPDVQADPEVDSREFFESTWGRELKSRRSPAGLMRRAWIRLTGLMRRPADAS